MKSKAGLIHREESKQGRMVGREAGEADGGDSESGKDGGGAGRGRE